MKKLLLSLFLLLSIGINAQPPSVMPEFTLCDTNGDGLETFDLTSQIPVILNGLNPNTTAVTFHETNSDAQAGVNAIVFPDSYTNIVPNVQTIYIRVVDNANSEIYYSTMALVVTSNNAGADGSTTICDSSSTPINLANLITGEQGGGTWTRVSGTGGTFNGVTGMFTPAVGATTSNFVYNVSGNQACPFDTSVATIIINPCVVPIVCGDTFTDPGGSAANYANNSNYTVTIYPTNPGEVVTVTFTSFATEAFFDALYVFNGNSTSAPQISSANPASNVPGGLAGGFWGNTIPGPFTSTSPDGSLTFRFRSDNGGTAGGWIANVTCGPAPTCSSPTALTTSAVTHNSVVLNWTQPANPDSSVANSWDIIALPCGSPSPTANSTGYIAVSTNAPYTLTGLTPAVCYSICVRAVCSENERSPWVCFNNVTTAAAPPQCGGTFTDNGGPTANYTNNSDNTYIICPTNPGEFVTATFVSFSTEATWDALYVFNGNSIASQQIASTNTAGNVPGGLAGGFWGTAIPGPFTSSSPDGCLTFRFRSDGTQNAAGWIANITCSPAPTCSVPLGLSVTAVTATSASVNWIQNPNPDTTIATEWEYIILPAGNPAPTSASTGVASSTNSVNVTALVPATCYTVYVRAVCSETEISNWSAGYNFCTQTAPPACGGQFVDNGGSGANYTNNADVTTTICPTTPGEIVSVIFNTFDVEATWDALYVFDGNSIAAPQIISPNPSSNVPGGLAGGFWGTAIPGPFVSTSPDGCLTFRFRSDGSQTRQGWTANVICTPDADKIVLVAFIDSNGNGIKDNGELLFPHGSFVYQQNSNGTDINGYSPTGQFALYDNNPANTYSFSYELQDQYAPYYNSGSTTYSNISIAVGSGTQFLYFPITSTQGYNDVTLSIAPINAPRPGFTYDNRITYRNQGTTATNGTITFAKPSQITTFTTSQAGVVNNVSGFTYAFTNLLPNEIRTFTVTMNVPLVPTVHINDILTATASITASANDINLANNASSNSQIVVNSWDPNDKMESRGKTIPFNTFNQDDYFFYTIRFQNNGTANAIDVRIEDVLNALKIDAESVRMVSASHNYTMKRINNQLIWDFKNIFLAPSTVSESGSRGYVQFKVKLVPGFQAGDIIPNNASIYFDSNPAIVTATFNSKFTVPLAVETFDSNNLVLYPNPATNSVNVDLFDTNEQISKVIFYDILGKTVKTIATVATESITVDVSNFPKGVYMVEIISDSNLKLTKKLIIQ